MSLHKYTSEAKVSVIRDVTFEVKFYICGLAKSLILRTLSFTVTADIHISELIK